MTIIEDRGTPVTTVTAEVAPDLATLLRRVAGGDHAAFAELYDQTCHRVYGMALRVLRDPGYSEETTQEVYLQVWRSAGTYDPAAGSAISWLITLTHRRAVDRVRTEAACTRRTIDYGMASAHCIADDISEVVESRERSRTVRHGLAHLTALQRESVDLAYFHGLTYREVADRLDVGLPTVKSRIRTGLIRLRAHVDTAVT